MNNHLLVIDKVEKKLRNDNNIIAFLLFGSVAENRHHENSDIDTIIVYSDFPTGYHFTTEVIDGIEISYSKWSLSELNKNIKNVPYLMYVFANAKIIFDKGSIISIQNNTKEYFKIRKDVKLEWEKHTASFNAEKNNIVDVFDKLEKIFSEGKTKRTFFIKNNNS